MDQIVEKKSRKRNISATFLTAQILNQMFAHLSMGEISSTRSKADLKRKEVYSCRLVTKEIKIPAD